MKLSFRFQFILAPFIIVIILACLIVYTLYELSNINRENKITRRWEVLTNRIQASIASANRVNKVIGEMKNANNTQQDDNYFDYIEQTKILSNSLLDVNLLSQISAELRQQIKQKEQMIRDPDRVKPEEFARQLISLMPALEHQNKIFAAQRRSAYIENHHKLVRISSRMTMILVAALIFCIVLAAGLGLWGLRVLRRRLNSLTQRANSTCVDSLGLAPAPLFHKGDELDQLDTCISNMISQLVNVLGVESVLKGAENERRRIAMDMHDGILADLTSINRKVDNIASMQNRKEGLTNLRLDIDNIISSLRSTIDDLHPQVLEILGLEPALKSFLDRNHALPGFPDCHFECDQAIEQMISIDYKLNLFRIVVEAIHNVIKHARCDKFEVCLRIIQQQLLVTIEDNGVGMPENNVFSGHGCLNMSERARMLGAEIKWRRSRFASGTCVELKLLLVQG